ncbi:MAG: DegV family protein [Lachnospiraceae bacterium]|nr:DegV family protein [Lachnospiraceae bacterium]
MTYKIIGDSCMDLTEETKKDSHFQLIPLTLQIDHASIIDDETFNQKDFLKRVKESEECPRSACPSPEMFKEAFSCEADMVFVITLSQHLSGTYNSAMVGKQMYEEEFGGEKKIHVFSSDSASVGETLIAFKIRELAEAGASFEEIVKKAQDFLEHIDTYFVLETLDFLKKNGRLTGLTALLATALNIKPIMQGDGGVIVKLDQARGIDRAVRKMCDAVISRVKNPGEKILAISHCNCPERAQAARDYILERISVKEVYLTGMAGVSSLYAGDGGVIICI